MTASFRFSCIVNTFLTDIESFPTGTGLHPLFRFFTRNENFIPSVRGKSNSRDSSMRSMRRWSASGIITRCSRYTLPSGTWSLLDYKALVQEQNNVISDSELQRIYRLACIQQDGVQEDVKKDINFILNCIKVINNEKVDDEITKFPKQVVTVSQLRNDQEVIECPREDLFKNAVKHLNQEYFIVPKRTK